MSRRGRPKMTRYLVVYYSRTGHTATLAKALAEQLGADLEPIREARSRSGWLEFWRSGRESWLGILPQVEPQQHDPARYDVVVLGSPVWASRPSTPVRAWLAANRDKLETIACFVTFNGSGAKRTLARMDEAAGRPAVATFAASAREVNRGRWKEAMERFADTIVASVERPSPVRTEAAAIARGLRRPFAAISSRFRRKAAGAR